MCDVSPKLALSISAGKLSQCTAVVDPQADPVRGDVQVQIKTGGVVRQVVHFRLFTVEAETLILTSSMNGAPLRPIAGVYDESDATCQTLQFQRAAITGSATFSDGRTMFENYDVSSLLRLTSSDQNVASVIADAFVQYVHGRGAGVATIYPRGYSAAPLTVHVADPADTATHIAVVGLDYMVLSSLGALTLTPAVTGSLPVGGYPRDSTVSIIVQEPTSVVLKREGQSARVVVSAVLADHSLIPLQREDGLVLVSKQESAAIVAVDAAGHRVYVPRDPVEAAGAILQATWLPNGTCYESAIAEQSIGLVVQPELPTKLEIKLSRSFLVACNDPAADTSLSEFATTAQVTVHAVFEDGRKDDITVDSRTLYNSTNHSLFTLKPSGQITSNDGDAIGEANIVVSFRGVTGYTTLEVAKFLDLEVRATPYPGYAGSSSYNTTMLRPIACANIYQRASMVTVMSLTNGKRATIKTASYVSSPPGLVSTDGGLVTPKKLGSVSITAQFAANVKPDTPGAPVLVSSSAPWMISVADVTNWLNIKSIDNMRLWSGGTTVSTFTGMQHVARAQLAFGATFDDGTKYEQAISNSGRQMLSGAFVFASSDAAIAVNKTNGDAVLADNHPDFIDLTVSTSCASQTSAVTSRLRVYANLQPSVGDADLGARSSQPVKPCEVGTVITVPISVNTDGRRLAGFEMAVVYSAQHLKFLKYSSMIKSADGKADILASQASDNEVSVNGLIQNSKVSGVQAAPVALFSVDFECMMPGESTLTGRVLKLTEAITYDNIGAATKSQPNPFVAGLVSVMVLGTQRRQSRHLLQIERSASLSSFEHSARKPVSRFVRDGLQKNPLWEEFDANCDGEFGVDDGAVIQSHVSFSNTELRIESNPSWVSFRNNILNRCGIAYDHYDERLDLDRNKAVTLLDATYLQNVLVGYYYLYDLEVASPVQNSCSTSATVTMQGVSLDGRSATAPSNVAVYLDVATSNNVPAINDALRRSGQLVTTNKGDSNLFGGLVQLKQSSSDATMFHFSLPIIGKNLEAPTNVLLSPLLVKNKDTTSVWLQHNHPFLDILLSAENTGSAALSGSLLYAFDALETSRDLPSKVLRPKGYRPLKGISIDPEVCASVPSCGSDKEGACTNPELCDSNTFGKYIRQICPTTCHKQNGCVPAPAVSTTTTTTIVDAIQIVDFPSQLSDGFAGAIQCQVSYATSHPPSEVMIVLRLRTQSGQTNLDMSTHQISTSAGIATVSVRFKTPVFLGNEYTLTAWLSPITNPKIKGAHVTSSTELIKVFSLVDTTIAQTTDNNGLTTMPTGETTIAETSTAQTTTAPAVEETRSHALSIVSVSQIMVGTTVVKCRFAYHINTTDVVPADVALVVNFRETKGAKKRKVISRNSFFGRLNAASAEVTVQISLSSPVVSGATYNILAFTAPMNSTNLANQYARAAPLDGYEVAVVLTTSAAVETTTSLTTIPTMSTGAPVTEVPTTAAPATEAARTTASATYAPSTVAPATEATSTVKPATDTPTSAAPATEAPPTAVPATELPTTAAPVTEAPTTVAPATDVPTTVASVTDSPATSVPGTDTPTSAAPATEAPPTAVPATELPTTAAPVTEAPSTVAPATDVPTTVASVTDSPATSVPGTDAPTTAESATDAPTTTNAPAEVTTVRAPAVETTIAETSTAQMTTAPAVGGTHSHALSIVSVSQIMVGTTVFKCRFAYHINTTEVVPADVALVVNFREMKGAKKRTVISQNSFFGRLNAASAEVTVQISLSSPVVSGATYNILAFTAPTNSTNLANQYARAAPPDGYEVAVVLTTSAAVETPTPLTTIPTMSTGAPVTEMPTTAAPVTEATTSMSKPCPTTTLEYFDEPIRGFITGETILDVPSATSVEACAGKCLSTPSCSSFQWQDVLQTSSKTASCSLKGVLCMGVLCSGVIGMLGDAISTVKPFHFNFLVYNQATDNGHCAVTMATTTAAATTIGVATVQPDSASTTPTTTMTTTNTTTTTTSTTTTTTTNATTTFKTTITKTTTTTTTTTTSTTTTTTTTTSKTGTTTTTATTSTETTVVLRSLCGYAVHVNMRVEQNQGLSNYPRIGVQFFGKTQDECRVACDSHIECNSFSYRVKKESKPFSSCILSRSSDITNNDIVGSNSYFDHYVRDQMLPACVPATVTTATSTTTTTRKSPLVARETCNVCCLEGMQYYEANPFDNQPQTLKSMFHSMWPFSTRVEGVHSANQCAVECMNYVDTSGNKLVCEGFLFRAEHNERVDTLKPALCTLVHATHAYLLTAANDVDTLFMKNKSGVICTSTTKATATTTTITTAAVGPAASTLIDTTSSPTAAATTTVVAATSQHSTAAKATQDDIVIGDVSNVLIIGAHTFAFNVTYETFRNMSEVSIHARLRYEVTRQKLELKTESFPLVSAAGSVSLEMQLTAHTLGSEKLYNVLVWLGPKASPKVSQHYAKDEEERILAVAGGSLALTTKASATAEPTSPADTTLLASTTAASATTVSAFVPLTCPGGVPDANSCTLVLKPLCSNTLAEFATVVADIKNNCPALCQLCKSANPASTAMRSTGVQPTLTAATAATTASGPCLDGYRGPLASYKGERRFKIDGAAGHITGIASAKLCSKTCDENANCLAFSHRGDKGVCQLYVSTAIGTLEAHDQYEHYFADSSCGGAALPAATAGPITTATGRVTAATTAAATTALAAITTSIATTAPGSCLDGYRGPLASYKGERRFKIDGAAGHITGIASAKLCSKTCDENANCLAFSHRGDKGVCQLYVSTAIGTLEAHDQYEHYFVDSSCGAAPPTMPRPCPTDDDPRCGVTLQKNTCLNSVFAEFVAKICPHMCSCS